MQEGKSWSGREHNCCFLNVGSERFANASAISGLDYIDDARASAVVDWDSDGDLDLWVTNRTGPRVRFLRNDTDSGHYVAVRLIGQSCNRDAIGARVEMVLRDRRSAASGQRSEIIGEKSEKAAQRSTLDARPLTLSKTLHAGDGFLAQSSKWLHFGLGEHHEVAQLSVRWPDGSIEEFANVKADRRYRIVQSTGTMQPWMRTRPVELSSSELNSPPVTERARVVMATPTRISNWEFASFDNARININELPPGPLLINLWSSSCVSCLKELDEFVLNEDRLRKKGLNIVAVHFHDEIEDREDAATTAKTVLDRLTFPFESGLGDRILAEDTNALLERVLQKHRGFSLPTSLLVDEKHRLAIVYKGTVNVEQLLADVDLLRADDAQIIQACVPFPGRWHESPIDGRGD